MTIAPSGAARCTILPQATGLPTNRTQCDAASPPENRPRPVTSAGSSNRRIGRPTNPPAFSWEVTALALRASLHRRLGRECRAAHAHAAARVLPQLLGGMQVAECPR